MAIAAFAAKKNKAGIHSVSGVSDPIAAINTVIANCDTARAIGNISGDSPSLTAVNLIKTNANVLKTLLTADVVFVFDTSVHLTKEDIRLALEGLKFSLAGNSVVS